MSKHEKRHSHGTHAPLYKRRWLDYFVYAVLVLCAIGYGFLVIWR